MLIPLLLLAGCAARTPIEAPALAEAPFPESAAADQPPPYRLQAGDLIAVRFWGNEELDDEQIIRPDGRISLPFIDEVPAAGLTPMELDARLTETYASELANPNITVIVRQAVPPRIYIGGEVGAQGAFQLTDNLTLSRAIQQAGGFTVTARRREVLLIRQQADGSGLARAVDLRPVLSGADPSLDVRLRANDVIFVPRTQIESVSLFIEQYIDGVVPLQNIFSGVILADLADSSSNNDGGGTPNPPTDGTGGGADGGGP